MAKTNRLLWVALSGYALLMVPVQGQGEVARGSHRFKHLSLEEGLSQVNVSHIYQDKSGFIWIATENGLNRYDGFEIQNYYWNPSSTESLSSNRVERVTEDRFGRLWVLSRMGLDILDPATGKVSRFRHLRVSKGQNPLSLFPVMFLDDKDFLWVNFGMDLERIDTRTLTSVRYTVDPWNDRGLVSALIQEIYQDSKGRLWITSHDHGISRYDYEQNRFIHFLHDPHDPSSLASNEEPTLFEDNQGVIWVGTKGGVIHRFAEETGTFTRFPVNMGAQGNPKTTIWLQDDEGWLWVSADMNERLSLFNPKTGDYIQPGSGRLDFLDNSSLATVYQGRSGDIWIGTWGSGLFRYDPDSRTAVRYTFDPRDPESISGNIITWIFQDPSGVYWFTTGSGISLLDERQTRFRNFDMLGLAVANSQETNIRTLLEDKEGIIWAGTLSGLKRINRSTGVVDSLPNNAPGTHYNANAVGSLIETLDHRLLLGTWGGQLFEVHKADRRFEIVWIPPPDFLGSIYKIIQDTAGELWICTLGKGLVRLNLDTGKSTRYRHKANDSSTLPIDEVFTIIEEESGIFWVGTFGGGLARLSRETGQFVTYQHSADNLFSLSSDDIRALHISDDGTLWIGTQGGGLNRYIAASGHFARTTMKDGLPNNTIYGILEDKQQTLWLSTNKGIANFDPATGRMRRYDKADGLQHDEFNTGAYFRNDRGELMFGGVFGFNLFSPEKIVDNRYVPPVHITQFELFDKVVPLTTDRQEFTHGQNSFSFEFTALSYAQNHKNQFAYMLEGYDQGWIQAGNRRFASYTNLSPGDYTFRVKASNNDGIWNEQGASQAIFIHPPFWGTFWFQALIILLTPVCVYLAFLWRVRQIRWRNHILQTMVRSRTKELEHAKQDAEEANALKSRFLTKMTHEIRTPLNAILGFAEVLKGVDSPTEEQKHYLDLIHESGDNLLQILNDVLDLNKIEENRVTLEKVSFSFRENIETLLRPFIQKAGRSGLRTLLHFDPSIPERVLGDPVRIRQVIINLFANALKFTSEGGIVVRFSRLPDDGTDVTLLGEIIDTGIGVPVEKQEMIFERFIQADDSITRRYGGSGLGLAIVRELVQLLGGEAGVESPLSRPPFPSPNPGARFWFTMILAEATHREEAPEPRIAALPPGLSVLVAEDNKVNQKLIVKMLQQMGVASMLAEDGAGAVTAAKDSAFDAVFMDVQMPVMDGYEATRRIKQMRPGMPIIGLSADVSKESIEKGMDAGMNDYLGKPIKKDKLQGKILEWCASTAKPS